MLSRTHNSARCSSCPAAAYLEQNPLPAGKRALARSWTCLRFLTSFVALGVEGRLPTQTRPRPLALALVVVDSKGG